MENRFIHLAAPYAAVSLTGRLAVALRTFDQYCQRRSLDHRALREFQEHLWRLPIALRTPDEFQAWFESAPAISLADDAEPERAALLAFAAERGVPPAELSALLDAVAEIAYGSFYGAPEDVASLGYLDHVLEITQAYGAKPPPVSLVASSRFADRHGWGELPDVQTLSRWRDAPGAA